LLKSFLFIALCRPVLSGCGNPHRMDRATPPSFGQGKPPPFFPHDVALSRFSLLDSSLSDAHSFLYIILHPRGFFLESIVIFERAARFFPNPCSLYSVARFLAGASPLPQLRRIFFVYFRNSLRLFSLWIGSSDGKSLFFRKARGECHRAAVLIGRLVVLDLP